MLYILNVASNIINNRKRKKLNVKTSDFTKDAYTLRYKTKSVEDNYLKFIFDSRNFQMLFIMSLTLFIYILYTALDLFVLGEHERSSAVLFHFSMIVLWTYLLPSIYYNFYRRLAIFVLYLMPIYAVIGTLVFSYYHNPIYVTEIYVILFWSSVAIGYMFLESVVVSSIMILVSGIFTYIFNIIDFEHYLLHIFLMISAWTLGLLASYIIERYSRNYYESEIKILHMKDELLEFNKLLETRVAQEIEKNQQHQKMMIWQSRHAQMGETLSMIAHQWRHPLNNLSLIIQNAVFKYSVNKLDDSAMSKLDSDSSEQIRQMSNTIKDFKNFFLPDNTSVKYDINRSIVDAVNIIKPMLESENISLNIETHDNVFVIGFPTELGQAIVNILINSKDALVENKIVNKSINLSLALVDNDVKIIIKDNGGGVPPEILKKIFDPYFSTKTKLTGTGLGLYMTKIIVEEHMHGKISVSNSDNGFVVQIVIPHDM